MALQMAKAQGYKVIGTVSKSKESVGKGTGVWLKPSIMSGTEIALARDVCRGTLCLRDVRSRDSM
eukprot:3753146-Rhodomonas_salina.1